jgi:hypothetical protein
MSIAVTRVLFPLLIGCASAGQVIAQGLYLPSVYKASFGDGFKTDKYKTGYYERYQDADNLVGMEYSRNHFQMGDWYGKGNQVSVVSKNTDQSGTTKNLTVGYNTLETVNALWTADASYSKRLHEKTTAEITYNRDRVEVQQSLTTRVVANNYNVSVEHAILAAIKMQFTLGETRYTDGNHRPLAKIKMTYDVLPEQGVNLQLRSRYFKNTDTGVTSGYFNPYRFVENIAAIEFNRTASSWNLSANVGYGRQAGGDDAKILAKAFEFSATKPITSGVYIKAKAGYFRSLGYNGPDFIYRYVSEDVIVVF